MTHLDYKFEAAGSAPFSARSKKMSDGRRVIRIAYREGTET